ncbi:hypothetical protein CUMW_175550 [Citrus unshiu]|uniref:MLO-like protein n=1 Tax=Citrus unshiu TaxID=55188 RepID=A0A2H5PX38_CITUN|nr:hypothetical protein CUMW_175550 [Citrus unshiu]
MAEGRTTLEYTPTWVVALVCGVIVIISLAVERFLHYIGKALFQGMIAKICISEELASKWLPCDKKEHKAATKSTAHFESFFSSFTSHHGAGRRLLAESSASNDYCAGKGKVSLLSITALHHLHIFIFVLAVVHVTFCALTILFGGS